MDIPLKTDKKIALERFSQLIWEARRFSHKNHNADAERKYREAEAFAQQNELIAEAQIAQAAILELNEQYDKARAAFEQAALNSANGLQGMAWFFLGSVYRELNPIPKPGTDPKEYKALDCFSRAGNDPEFEKRNWALNNLANLYFRFGDYKKATALYLQSLDQPDDTDYITHYNLGRLCLQQGDFDGALQWFEKALGGTKDDFDLRGACYREMGTAHIIAFFADETKGKDNAVANWNMAIFEFEEHNRLTGGAAEISGKAAVAKAKIRLAGNLDNAGYKLSDEDRVLLEWWPPDEAGPDGYSTPEERIFSKIESIGQDRYLTYNSKPRSRFAACKDKKGAPLKPPKNVLAILRGWGSATPLIEDDASACTGGGYFIKWRDKGLVIDPGLDFVRNYRGNGFHMREVDAVVVSHNHTDHNFDLAALDDIFYEMHRRSVDKTIRDWTYLLYCDEETNAKEFLKGKPKHRKKTPLSKERAEAGENKEERFDLTKEGLPFVLHFFGVRHGEIPAYGVRVECLPEKPGDPPVVIGFTCDTEYFDDEADNLWHHLQGCHVLVAHISQPTQAELLTADKPKAFHLGYRGVAKLIRKVKPGLTVLGEFWAGIADMRIDLTKGIKRICEGATVLPGSIGLFIDPGRQEIECSNCRRWEPASNMHITSSVHEFGPLKYVCSLCRLQP